MSNITEESIACPKCQKNQQVKKYSSVNITLKPELKDKIKSGYFFAFECEECGVKIPMIYPCLYHDMENKNMIWLVPNCTNEQVVEVNNINSKQDMVEDLSIGYKKRIVKNTDSFREKIVIWDEGLDDKAIELLKIVYISKFEADLKERKLINVLFEVLDNNYAFIFVFNEGEPAMANIDMDMYRNVVDVYMSKIEDQETLEFSIVSGEWAKNIIMNN